MSEETAAAKGEHRPIDRKLLDLLVCPVTKGVLHYDQDAQELVSASAKLAYPIRDGIPIMLVEEARDLTDAELAAIKSGAGKGG